MLFGWGLRENIQQLHDFFHSDGTNNALVTLNFKTRTDALEIETSPKRIQMNLDMFTR